jgi:hypothetical protein
LEELKSDDAPAEDEPDRKVEEIREVDEQEEGGGWERLKQPWIRPALVVAIGLAVLQQLIGINTIIYYAPTTLTSVGYGAESAIYANLAIGTLNVAMTVLAIRLVDRVGRKPMLLAGLIGMILSLVVLGVSRRCSPSPTRPAIRPRSSRSSAWPASSPRLPPPGGRWFGWCSRRCCR